MAKDDYFVIVYQILSYLYQRLKSGEEIDQRMLQPDGPLYSINKQYWAYVFFMLQQEALVEGITFVDAGGLRHPYPVRFDRCYITPKGIAYLHENSFLEKAKSFLKEGREILPFP